MLTIEEIKAGLQDRRIDIVADLSGVGYGTVRDIRAGINTNPKYEVILRLSEYLTGSSVKAGGDE